MENENKTSPENMAPKKQGPITRIFLFLVLPITGPFILMKGILTRLIHFFKSILKSLPRNFKEFKRSMADAKHVMQDQRIQFNDMLLRWRIEEDEIPSKIREAYFHTICWGVTSAITFIAMLMHQNVVSLFVCAVFIVATIGTLSSLWKIEVLKERQYIQFFTWLRFWN